MIDPELVHPERQGEMEWEIEALIRQALAAGDRDQAIRATASEVLDYVVGLLRPDLMTKEERPADESDDEDF